MEETAKTMKERLVEETRAVRGDLQTLSYRMRLASDKGLLPRMFYLRAWLLSEFRLLNPDDDENENVFRFDAREADALLMSLACLNADVNATLCEDGTDAAREIIALSGQAMQAFETMLASWYEAFLAL